MAIDTKFLRTLQDHTVAKLLSEPLLQYVSIVAMRNQVKLAPEARVAPHLAGRNGKVGAGILVQLPIADPSEDADVPGAQMDIKLPIDILVKDDLSLVLSNGAGITAEEIAATVWVVLHQFLNRAIGSGNWTVGGFDPIEDRKGAYGYSVLLVVRGANDQPPKVTTPGFALAGGNVTLTSVEAGSAIYYTVNGAFPGSGEPTATLYAAPFAVVSGQTVLFAAQLANHLGSDVGMKTIP